MKKVVVLLLFLLFITGCTSLNNISSTNLNDLQKQACNSASNYDTCNRLQDINIVTKEECCKELKKCC